jgi:hypothetical protein
VPGEGALGSPEFDYDVSKTLLRIVLGFFRTIHSMKSSLTTWIQYVSYWDEKVNIGIASVINFIIEQMLVYHFSNRTKDTSNMNF